MSEKVLFELRIHRDEDGTRIEINESAEWRAYHGPNCGPDRRGPLRARRANRGSDGPFAWATRVCGEADNSADPESDSRKRPSRADDLRWALNSLQNIYDDLYGDATA